MAEACSSHRRLLGSLECAQFGSTVGSTASLKVSMSGSTTARRDRKLVSVTRVPGDRSCRHWHDACSSTSIAVQLDGSGSSSPRLSATRSSRTGDAFVAKIGDMQRSLFDLTGCVLAKAATTTTAISAGHTIEATASKKISTSCTRRFFRLDSNPER